MPAKTRLAPMAAIAIVTVLSLMYWSTSGRDTQQPRNVRTSEAAKNEAPPKNGGPNGSPRPAPSPTYSTPIERIGPKATRLTGSVFPPGGSAVRLIQDTGDMALNGDSQAALLIFVKIQQCLEALRDQGNDEVLMRNAQTLGGIDNAIIRQQQLAEDCQGLSPGLYENRGKWLEASASSGNVVAQLLYAADPEAVIGTPARMLQHPEKLIAYKSQAMNYLLMAASHGSLDAVSQLGRAYSNGILVERQPVRAYAYFLAAAKADPSIPLDPRTEELKLSLSDIQRNESTLIARSIYRECCEMQ